MKLVKPNWYGINHEEVNNRFEGGLTFIACFCINGEYNPCTVYRSACPDVRKGHKRYMLLSKTQDEGFIVRGLHEEQAEQFRFQDALHCLGCDDVVYSVNRHDFRSCTCGDVHIDGGRDYTKISYKTGAKFAQVVVDFLTSNVLDHSKTIILHTSTEDQDDTHTGM